MYKWFGGRKINVALNGELLKEPECFKYLESMVTVDLRIKKGEV